MRARRGAALAAAVAATVVGGAIATAGAGGASFVAADKCLEHQAFVDGDDAAVAARLPKRYTPVRDSGSGRPLVFARALHCEQGILDDRTAPLTLASIGVVVESPDGKGCGSATPGVGGATGSQPPLCNWYTLFWVSNDRGIVDWLRAGTPGVRAVYVPNLVFQAGAADPATGGAPFHFEAPAGAPSQFTIDDVARERPGELSVRGGYWTDTPKGTVKLAISTDDLSGGDATGVVRAPHGSDMAALMGADEREYAQGYTAFAAVRIGHGSYRKQLLWPAANTDSFAGSCSFQGDVAFDPPATNSQADLTSSYDASGTCSGTLDGRSVSDVPVKIRDSGPAYGSCIRAHTTAPWVGVLTFADGTALDFTLDFTTVATEVDGTVYGERSGSAAVHATFATNRTPPDVSARCISGLKQVPMDLTLSTDAPLVSDRPALLLSVKPRHARAERRTAFTFRVAKSDGRAVAGTLVRFAGKRAQTGRRGRATIVATLHRAGVWRASATKAGFAIARASVRVRAR